MKRFTAAEAKSRFAEFLEELSAGRPVAVELEDREVVVRADGGGGDDLDDPSAKLPSDDAFLEDLHRWGWELGTGGLTLVDKFEDPVYAEAARKRAKKCFS